MLPDPLRVAARVADAFTQLGVDYVIGGSVASSLYGIPRATHDVDIVAALDETHVATLASLLEAECYIDVDMVRDAVARRATFNIVHLATMYKADIFIMKADAWSRLEMSRGQIRTFQDGDSVAALRFASAEDTLLHKLTWYRLGGEASDRQWRDILGVLRISGPLLDAAYLSTWANELGVGDLLKKAHDASLP